MSGPAMKHMPIQHNPSHLYQLWFIPSPKYFHTVDVFPSLSPSFFWLLVISCLILARTFSKGAAHERKHWHRRIWRYRRHKPVLSLCADTIGPLITGLMHPPPGLYAQVVFVLLKCWGHCQCVCVCVSAPVRWIFDSVLLCSSRFKPCGRPLLQDCK